MVQILFFFFFIGVWALIFSRTERLTYVDGIYFAVVTTLTIGFGDVTPHTAAMKVLIFPFTIIGITLLAVIITSIVRLLSDRTRRRKLQMKRQLKAKASEKKRNAAQKSAQLTERPQLKRSLTLQEELYQLAEENWKRQTKHNLKSVVIGLGVFFAFWFIGALIFCFTEVDPLITSLTVGLGIWKCSLFLLHVSPASPEQWLI
jgi:potassium channel subfamily K, other eukaryote